MGTDAPILYGYWRSTAAFRVRIALNLKGIEWEHRGVDLVAEGGQQHGADYLALNPSRLVPTLVWNGVALSQSLAICEFLDEQVPAPALLPPGATERAAARALALDIGCDMHPLNNLRVQQYLGRELGIDGAGKNAWMHHWMALGFAGIEQRLKGATDRCCFGDDPGIADIFLVAQAYNADRFGFDLSSYTQISRIVAHCRGMTAFREAAPEAQADAR